MLFAPALLVALLASVNVAVSSAQLRRQILGFPACATNCLNTPTNLGGCQITDEACLCKSVPYLVSTLACIDAACPAAADQQMSVVGAQNLCLNFGVTLTAQSSAIFGALSTLQASATPTSPGAAAGSQTAPAGASSTPTTGASQKLSAAPVSISVFGAVLAMMAL